jgi:hypothetical protein
MMSTTNKIRVPQNPTVKFNIRLDSLYDKLIERPKHLGNRLISRARLY